MKLRHYLEQIASESDSYFQAHLAKEDLSKVDRLFELADAATTIEAYQKDALYLGWTPGDLRSGELKEVLLPLSAAAFAYAQEAEPGDVIEEELLTAWKNFHDERIKVLIHCL